MSKLKIPKNYTVEKVLITASDVTVDVEESEYFNKVLGLDIFY